jgi:hypothetical protein
MFLFSRVFLLFCVLCLCSSLSGCKSLYDRDTYVKAPVKGALGGSEWSYIYGYTDAEAKLPEGSEHLLVLTPIKPPHACPEPGDKKKDGREVSIAIDGKVGEMIIGARSDRYETADDAFTYKKKSRLGSAAFFDPKKSSDKQYQFATTGKIRILKISATEIEGMIVAKLNPDNFINGRFKAKICKWGQLN